MVERKIILGIKNTGSARQVTKDKNLIKKIVESSVHNLKNVDISRTNDPGFPVDIEDGMSLTIGGKNPRYDVIIKTADSSYDLSKLYTNLTKNGCVIK